VTIPGKLVGGSHPSAVLNSFAPTDRMPILYGFIEGTGNALANLGLGNTCGSNWPAPVDNAIVGTPTWLADPDGAPYVQLSGSYINIHHDNAADLVLPRGLFFAHVRPLASGMFLTSGSPSGTIGHCSLAHGTLDGIEGFQVNLRVDASTLWSAFLSAPLNQWHTLLFSWGERGLLFAVDRLDCDDPTCTYFDPTKTAGWKVLATKYLRLQGSAVGASGAGAWSVAGFGDGQLRARHRHDLMCDPHLPLRPPPSRTLAFDPVAATDVGRVTQTQASILQTTGHGASGALASAAVGWRVRASKDRYAVLDATPVACQVASASDIDTPLVNTLTGLTPGAWYYYFREFTTDGNIWRPFPTGFGVFRAQPPALAQLDPADTAAIEAAQRGRANSWADAHTGAGKSTLAPAEDGYDPVVHGFGQRLLHQTALPINLASYYYVWLAEQDAYLDDDPADLNLCHGDEFYHGEDAVGTADTNPALYPYIAVIKDLHFQRSLTGMTVHLWGNHEGGGGNYTARYGLKAAQKQAQDIWDRYTLYPLHDTYPEGGEHEGDPTLANDISWLPPLSATYDAAWRATFAIPATPRGGKSLGNYFAFTWAGCLVLCLDVHRYSFIGGATIAALGAPQRAWLRGVLAGSRATWKEAHAHALLGGDVDYQWGSGRRLGLHNAEEVWLDALLRGAGFQLYECGHNHTFGHIYRGGLVYHSVGSPSALMFVDGINHLMAISFGTAESEGATLYGEAPGSGRAAGVVQRLHIQGYARKTWTRQSYQVEWRQTAVVLAVDGSYVLTDRPTLGERYGGQLVEATGGLAPLREAPRHVAFAIPQSVRDGLPGDWWTTPNIVNAPTDTPPGHNYRAPDPPGPYAHDEDQAAATVALDPATPNGPTYVLAVPWTAYRFELPRRTRLLVHPQALETGDELPTV